MPTQGALAALATLLWGGTPLAFKCKEDHLGAVGATRCVDSKCEDAMSAGSHLAALFDLFPPSSYLHDYAIVPADQVPEPYHRLLVHEHHMTVTVEAHHASPVDVQVVERRHDGDSYARKILLARQSDGRIVQFGLVRIWLQYCSAKVRAEILSEKTPLGRILIQHNVLRRIEPTQFLRVTPGADMMRWFELSEPTPTYGRSALIHCDSKPAIELLEVVSPE